MRAISGLFSFHLYSLAACPWISTVRLHTPGYTYVLDQHETLGVRDDLRCVQSLLKVRKESLAVSREAWAGPLEKTSSATTLLLERTQATSEHGLADQSNRHAEIQSVDGGPLAGTLLASGIHDLLNNGDTVVVVLVHDVAGNLNEERVEDALVPLGEDVTHLLVAHSKTALHDVVRLSSVSFPYC
jgi:hypothetical protein